jgi:uncharacterized protein (TIGR03437 family)
LVAPNIGTTPKNLLINIAPANLGIGTYDGTVTVTSAGLPSQAIHVHLTVGAATVTATPASLTLSEAAGGVPVSQNVQISGVPAGTTIGALVTLFNGSGWLTATTSGNTVTVTADGSKLSTNTTYTGVVSVIVPGASNSPLYVPVSFNVSAQNAFALSATVVNFNYQTGTAANLSPNKTNPAAKGTTVSISVTGEGALNPAAATGSMSGPSLPLPKPIANVSVTIGGQPAAVSYAGEAPTLVSGVMQINATIPDNIGSQNQTVVVAVGNNSTKPQPITVNVQ